MGQQPQTASIPAGTRVDARLESGVETASSNPGDPITAIVASPVRSGTGIILPKGSRLIGRVETIEPATFTSEGRVRLVFREIQLADGRRVSSWITNSFSASPPRRKLRYILCMGIGSAAGGFIGGRRARVSGIIGGTLLGAIMAGNSGNGKHDLVLKTGRMIRLQFGEDLNLK
jgi:hypothetical protein